MGKATRNYLGIQENRLEFALARTTVSGWVKAMESVGPPSEAFGSYSR